MDMVETIDQELIIQLFDAQPQAVLWFRPVPDGQGTIIDFEYAYVNEEALRYLDEPREKVLGMRISNTPLLPENARQPVIREMLHAYHTGERVNADFYNTVLNKHVKLQRLRIGGGVLTILEDRTAEHLLLEEIKSREAFTESILNSSMNGIFVARSVTNDQGDVVDLEFEKINPAFTQITGYSSEIIGKKYLSIFPTSLENGTFQRNIRVLKTGIPERWQVHYVGDGINGWYDVSANRLNDRIVVTFNDITAEKLGQIETEKQKNFLDNILRYSPSGITVTKIIRDSQGNIVDGKTIISNEMSEHFTGIPAEETLTKNISEIDPGLLSSPLFTMAKKTIETGEPFRTQYFLEGAEKWFELSVARLDSDHLVNVFSDVTQQKKAQMEVEDAAITLRTVIDAAQTGMFTVEPVYNAEAAITDFRYLIVNQALADFKGRTPQELVGTLVSSSFTGFYDSGIFDLYRETFEKGVRHRREIRYKQDETERYLDIQSTPIGKVLFVTFTDFTPLRRTQNELECSIEELKRSNASLEEFSYAASHDLQEPLRKVYTFSDRLKSRLGDRLDPQELQMFERMESATVRMRALIDDLLTFSQVGIDSQTMIPVSLEEVVQEVISDMEIAIEQKAAQVEIRSLPVVSGNRRQLKQVLQNLLSNALKYSNEGVTPHITFTTRLVTGQELPPTVPEASRASNFHLVEVQDNGIGFEPENAERIFKIFQRLHGKSEYSGTGVGLAITKKVIDNHNGFITAEGQVGAGATFRIYLPAGQ